MVFLEKKILNNVKKECQESLTLLKSILGVGNKIALVALVYTDGFQRFQSAK